MFRLDADVTTRVEHVPRTRHLDAVQAHRDGLIVPFSCKTRGACRSCGQKRAIAWAERMVEEVLPDVPYVQLVFTIPKILRKGFLFRRKLYGEHCRAAYAATRKFFAAQFPTLQKAVPADQPPRTRPPSIMVSGPPGDGRRA